jgi:hypothetical protein|uniref:hypothetical protein n=1 Tax=Polaribacter sp. TaxID=1920175 RepID=UPI004048A377
MHKKLVADLTSLAHSILQLKNKEDIFVLKQKAYEVYEKLAVLAYVEEYINTTPTATETKEELLSKIEEASPTFEWKPEAESFDQDLEEESLEEVTNHEEILEEEILEEETFEEEIDQEEMTEEELPLEQPFDELEGLLSEENEDEPVEETPEEPSEEVVFEVKKFPTLDEELSDTISIDVAADLFGKPTGIVATKNESSPNLQIGLNDRIAFVKQLFGGSQEDFNRVISQLNTLKTLKEAKKFINKMVKPDYNWDDKEEYEQRFMEIVERTFNN